MERTSAAARRQFSRHAVNLCVYDWLEIFHATKISLANLRIFFNNGKAILHMESALLSYRRLPSKHYETH